MARGASFFRLIWRQPNIEMERSGIEMGMACSLVQKGNLAPAVPSSESETGSMACNQTYLAPASSRLQAARTHQRSCGQDVA